ncbi:hypothetical protein QA646_14770 [Rhizobium sp. CB3090]|uniref:hypothetical protein n=1 Tax=Rhizobium sp. CB3090 TaxID=3039156 RepID=UPI0024B23CCC|nr:hypothetical protein [Rhizobium sp. CB3090]WFU08546.1 hypothetical protein QA646_14770 [Rhizobium sp. CB3090]
MGQHLFKAATLVLAAAALLSTSASAGDYHQGYRPFRHDGPFPLHEASWPQRHAQPRPAGIVLMDRRYPTRLGAYAAATAVSADYRHGYRPFHHRGPVRLQQISWPQRYSQPQPARIILMDRQYAANIGTYAGTADMYQADGGTYIVGYGGGYDPYQNESAALKPRAKVIDVKRAGNACSYEAGVCVIRP